MMATVDHTQLLAQCPTFREMHMAGLQVVLQAAHQRGVERNAFFFHQGEPATTFYVLVQGAKLTQVTSEGNQMLMRYAGPGECFGGIAVLSSAVYTLSAQAVDDCLALAWDGETLAGLIERYPRIALNMIKVIAGHYRRL
ncbi:MAG: cyclic nucleotide-binding domain-containing protein, partial [Anaerolineae bacterium]|nr:cyclic nucleotide-binding domain-containing protein [Anaerolineae bacterium]